MRVNSISSYYKQLDGLRFISISAVLFEHFVYSSVGQTLPLAQMGVDIFFVISGFLITENLIKLKEEQSKAGALKIFFFRRFLRIFPLYYLYWLILLVFFLPQVTEVKYWGLFYVLNFYDIYHDLPNLTGHLWSLSVEEQFYVFWPLIVLFTPLKWIRLVIAVIFAASLVFIGLNFNHPIPTFNYFHTFSCAPALLTGSFLALLKNSQSLENIVRLLGKSWFILLMIGIVAMLLPILFGQRHIILTRLMMCLVSFYMVAKTAVKPFNGIAGVFFSNRWIRKIGQIAYGIYIYHYLVFTLVYPHLLKFYRASILSSIPDDSFLKYLRYDPSLVLFPVTSLCVIAIAWISYTYFEAPIMRFKRNLKTETGTNERLKLSNVKVKG